MGAVMEFRALGKKVVKFVGLETFPAPPNARRIVMVSDEVTALCPITALPDWYTITIDYCPSNLCLESKSLKLYFHSLRDMGEFCENLAQKICDDAQAALSPESIEVTVKQKPRGGIGQILAGTVLLGPIFSIQTEICPVRFGWNHIIGTSRAILPAKCSVQMPCKSRCIACRCKRFHTPNHPYTVETFLDM